MDAIASANPSPNLQLDAPLITGTLASAQVSLPGNARGPNDAAARLLAPVPGRRAQPRQCQVTHGHRLERCWCCTSHAGQFSTQGSEHDREAETETETETDREIRKQFDYSNGGFAHCSNNVTFPTALV